MTAAILTCGASATATQTAAPAPAAATAVAVPNAAVTTIGVLLLSGERSLFYGGFDY